MAGSDKRKQSLYFPEQMLREIKEEASRQDRSLSWIVQKAWKTARRSVMDFPSVNDIPDTPLTPVPAPTPTTGDGNDNS
ncbi:MAG: TIGR04563 family protein [Kofleriaceae bacterium]|nr:TIGR04563 family protein [Kofleriaceae bacterium]